MEYNALASAITWIHIVAGALALVCGMLAMLVKKGGRVHKKSGMIYFTAMVIIFLTALPMSYYKSNWFLLMISVFSVYMTFTGYRGIRIKDKKESGPLWFDWMILAVASIFGISMLVYAAIGWIQFGSNFSIILGVFGLVLSGMAWGDLQHFRRIGRGSEKKMYWFLYHIGRMVGAYIATSTAFVTNNFQSLPMLVQWLGPTVIGVTAIFLWIRKYRRKFGLIAS